MKEASFHHQAEIHRIPVYSLRVIANGEGSDNTPFFTDRKKTVAPPLILL